MSMAIGSVNPLQNYYATAATKLVTQPAQTQQPTSPVQQVSTDSDGDNDGSKGRFIDAYA